MGYILKLISRCKAYNAIANSVITGHLHNVIYSLMHYAVYVNITFIIKLTRCHYPKNTNKNVCQIK